jgi:hypothetical protein
MSVVIRALVVVAIIYTVIAIFSGKDEIVERVRKSIPTTVHG